MSAAYAAHVYRIVPGRARERVGGGERDERGRERKEKEKKGERVRQTMT